MKIPTLADAAQCAFKARFRRSETAEIVGADAVFWHGRKGLPALRDVVVLQAENAAEKLPLTADKKSVGDSLIFVCTGRASMPPVSHPADALRLL